ncbi:nuclear transport factor 2 family protein [Lysobacter sp. BMK333-48F3]|uniref:nuclear transport factor 2 family protein n=1 Tax=Lysobacter sp. BMK333-48F3 TaxID=2867962 RepID=UPI001C8B25F6|nr:nuclear transport factor 2 family protein [Lysobacter sp. BMK333-48F3]MBX9400611.1 nuclear transport factor 2 family protein [Lysobacter sp. BMK333-48F3]
MKSLRPFVFAAALLIAASASSAAETSVQSVPDADLQAMLRKYADAATLFYNGRAEAVKALWSHSDDVTLSGAAGGATAKGWSEVSSRLDWASSQFLDANGTKRIEQVQTAVSGELAYIVQYEHIRYRRPGYPEGAQRDYRVTTIFRREPEGWRVVHRHADTLMQRQDIR